MSTVAEARPRLRAGLFREYGIVLVFIALVIVLTIISPNHSFASGSNMVIVLKQTAINGILAMGMMFVIIAGQIDLSVGSIVAVSGVAAALFAMPGEYPLIVPVIAALIVGGLVGLFNGVAVAYGPIPSFIVTLGTLTMARGLALIMSGGGPVTGVSRSFENIAGTVGGIPLLAIYFVIVVAICAVVITSTVFARHVYAVGGNAVAARVSGVNVNRVTVAVFTISGTLAGLAGLLNASRTITGAPNAGVAYELDAIAAVIIGGVSMTGGIGKWYGVVVGALLIAVMANGLDILGVDSNFQQIIKGAIIIVAVFLDIRTKKRVS